MKIKDLADFEPEDINKLLGRVPFFKELQREDAGQLALLMEFSCIVELESGEIIMRRGDRGSWLYFLIKGNLSVYLHSAEQEAPLNHITPGELFGDLALLCDHERKATVAADKGTKGAVLFATDFKPFGDIYQFDTVSLYTKLVFYRTMVHSIRWRLEQKRMVMGSETLSQELRSVKSFVGEKGSAEELQSLFEQAQLLASILDRWNSEGADIEDVVVVAESSS